MILLNQVTLQPIVTEASRGCPHPCTYCQLNIKRAPYRVRPVEDVIRDLTNTKGLPVKRKTGNDTWIIILAGV